MQSYNLLAEVKMGKKYTPGRKIAYMRLAIDMGALARSRAVSYLLSYGRTRGFIIRST